MDPLELRARCDHLLEQHESGELEPALDAASRLAADAAEADTAHPIVRESLFTARFERALILSELGALPEAADAYAEAAETPADLDDPDQRHEIAMALLNRGICLDAVGDHDAAIRTYDQVLMRFRAADDPVTHDLVVRTRVNRASALLAEDRIGEALTAAEVLIAELDPGDTLEAEQLAMCVRLRAAALTASERVAEAAEALTAVERCTDADPAARAQVAAALRERARFLVDLDRREDAIAGLDRLAARFPDEDDPAVLEELEQAASLRALLAEV
jgi:tetratricopeptide (TPR) repeat protein